MSISLTDTATQNVLNTHLAEDCSNAAEANPAVAMRPTAASTVIGTYINGAYPSVPAVDMTPSGISLHSGHVFAVHLVYASQLTTGRITDTLTGVSASMNFTGDITEAVGDNAWFGFTGGTRANSETQQILTWSYSSGTGVLQSNCYPKRPGRRRLIVLPIATIRP